MGLTSIHIIYNAAGILAITGYGSIVYIESNDRSIILCNGINSINVYICAMRGFRFDTC